MWIPVGFKGRRAFATCNYRPRSPDGGPVRRPGSADGRGKARGAGKWDAVWLRPAAPWSVFRISGVAEMSASSKGPVAERGIHRWPSGRAGSPSPAPRGPLNSAVNSGGGVKGRRPSAWVVLEVEQQPKRLEGFTVTAGKPLPDAGPLRSDAGRHRVRRQLPRREAESRLTGAVRVRCEGTPSGG